MNSLHQVFTGAVPFPEARTEGSAIHKIMSGERPQRPVFPSSSSLGLSDGVWDLMKRCWDVHRSVRPTASGAIATLESEWLVVGARYL